MRVGIADTSRGLMLAAFLFAGPGVRADEFLAMPGLWQTTLKVKAGAATTQWHCVDEEVDPWRSFVPLPEGLSPKLCERTDSQRTATTLQWQMACKGPAPFTSEGQLNFDSALHYTGHVVETRQVDGKAQKQSIAVEGQRRAACTTPAD